MLNAFVVQWSFTRDRLLTLLIIVAPMMVGSLWFTVESFGRELVLWERGIESRSPWGRRSFPLVAGGVPGVVRAVGAEYLTGAPGPGGACPRTASGP